MTDDAIFVAALEKQTSAERSAYLEACAGDKALRQRIASLLDAHEAAGNYLGRPSNRSRPGPARRKRRPR
jgi:hypothetical protein